MSVTEPPDLDISTRENLPDDALDLKVLLPVMLGDDSVLPKGFDRERYIKALDAEDFSEEDKQQLINFCYVICDTAISAFFRVSPEIIAQERKRESLPKTPSSVVPLRPSRLDGFKSAAELPQDKK